MIPEGYFGKLLMPTSPELAGSAIAWIDILSNRIVASVFIILVLISFKDIVDILKSVGESFSLKHGHIHLEHNRSKARLRNHLAWLLSVPFALIADRYELFRPEFCSRISDALSLPILYGMLLAYAALRGVLYLTVPKRLRGEEKTAAVQVPFTYLIPLVIIMLATGGIGGFFSGGENVVRTLLYVETGMFYLISTIKTGQIFADTCGVSSTFLYLCALEIIPAGLFIAAAMLF